jgi:LPXTG-motif cell wall-anchored protein
MRRISTLLVVLVALLVAPSVASAQQYPINGQTEVKAFGAKRAGESFNKEDCGFLAGSNADIRVNDTAAGSKTVERDGCVRMVVRIVDEDTISIDGTEYPAKRCRDNSIFVTAPVAGGAAQRKQAENKFTIVCAAAAGKALPRTGTDIAGLAGAGGLLVVVGATVVMIVRRRRTLGDTAPA